MGLSASEVFRLAARLGAKAVEEQSNQVAKFFDQKIDIMDAPGQTGYVNVKSGGIEPTGFIPDATTLPVGGEVDITQLYYTPKFMLTRLKLPRGGIDLANGVKDGVRLLVEQLQSTAADVARQRGRAVFNQALCSPAATSSPGNSFTTADVAGLRAGAKVEVFDNTGAFKEAAVIDRVDFATGPLAGGTAYTVYLKAAHSLTWNTTDVIYLHGAKQHGIVSLADVCANASLYGHPTTSDDWSGNLDSNTDTLGEGAMRSMHDQIRVRRGTEVSCIVMNPITTTRYLNLSTDQRRFMSGDVLDKYGSLRPTFDGVEIFTDVNCGSKDVFFFQAEDYKIHRFRKFGPETDGMKSPAMGMAATIISQTSFTYDIQMWEALQGRVPRRNGTGHMSNIKS